MGRPLIEQFKKGMRNDKRSIRNFVSRSTDGLEALTAPRLRLFCPIALCRQEIPVRTDNCRHLQTFDLPAFLQYSKNNKDKKALNYSIFSHIKCPVCMKMGTLVRDVNVAGYLRKFGDSVKEVKITETGMAVPIEDNAAEDFDSSIVDLSDSLAETSICDPANNNQNGLDDSVVIVKDSRPTHQNKSKPATEKGHKKKGVDVQDNPTTQRNETLPIITITTAGPSGLQNRTSSPSNICARLARILEIKSQLNQQSKSGRKRLNKSRPLTSKSEEKNNHRIVIPPGRRLQQQQRRVNYFDYDDQANHDRRTAEHRTDFNNHDRRRTAEHRTDFNKVLADFVFDFASDDNDNRFFRHF